MGLKMRPGAAVVDDVELAVADKTGLEGRAQQIRVLVAEAEEEVFDLLML
ncbi:MAG: hypothetical protein R2748_16580 [Bryobacterales bacterium]